MRKEIFICIGIIILIFYFSSPVPYCKIIEEQVDEGDAIYTLGETSKIEKITATLLKVKGTSMLPAIKDNSKCLCIKKENYEVGDVIFFFAEINGQFHGISHRIVVIDGEEIITKGDNNNFLDSPMTKKNIICAILEMPRYKVIF